MTSAGPAPVIQVERFKGRDIIVQLGLNTTPATYQARVKKFLANYLGSSDKPVPFGGRDDAIAQLNNWLADPDVPRNFLITAPAGRGKTALLVRWATQLPPDVSVVFLPISIRFGTNRANLFYQALAARLAAILEETLPATPSDPAEFYKEKVIEYLDRFGETNRQCLVVIDGLDEATGWQFDATVVPAFPPPGLRIIASARQLAGDHGSADWLRRLGWTARNQANTYEVPTLTRAGIADVLEKMGFPLAHLAKDVDVIGELLRLTEGGDPLLLEFYVNDLREHKDIAARLTPQDLRSREPGFGAYFKDWFELQQRVWAEAKLQFDQNELNAILALLSCALGPLDLAALSQLLSRLLDNRGFITVQTLDPIQRFVIGDGVENGFALGHPKLAEYLQGEYFGQSRIIIQAKQCFLDWGRSVVKELNTGIMGPAASPRYCLLYYVQHLEAEQPRSPTAHYRELIEDGWRSAWYALEKGFSGFAGDLEIAWRRMREAVTRNPAVMRSPLVGLGGLMRCALCLSSIRSIGVSVPANFLAEMVREELLGPRQALQLCRLKPEREHAAALRALAPLLGPDLLLEAAADVRGLRDASIKCDMLAVLAMHLEDTPRAELLDEALRLAAAIDDPYRRAATERFIAAAALPRGDRLEPATASTGSMFTRRLPVAPAAMRDNDPPQDLRRELDRALASGFHMRESLSPLVGHLSPDLLAHAVEQVLNVSSHNLGELLGILGRRLPDDLLRQTFARVLQFAPYELRNAVIALAPYLPSDLHRQALDAILRLDHYRGDALPELMKHLPPELLADAVAGVADNILDLDKLLPLLSEKDRESAVRNAYGIAFQIRDGLVFPAVFTALANRVSQERAAVTIEQARAIACGLRDQHERALSLLLISTSPQVPRQEARSYFEDAIKQIRESGSGYVTGLAMVVLAPVATEQDLQNVLAELRQAQDVSEEEQNLIYAVLALSPKMPSDGLEHAVETANAGLVEQGDDVEDKPDFVAIVGLFLLSASPHLTREQAQKYLRAGLDQSAKLSDKEEKFMCLLLGLLSPVLLPEMANRVEADIRAILPQQDKELVWGLTALVLPYAPQPMSDWLMGMFLDSAITMKRVELLIVLSVLEGGWGDLIKLRPAIAQGQPAQSVLTRIGGTTAAEETLSAIQDVKRWWP